MRAGRIEPGGGLAKALGLGKTPLEDGNLPHNWDV
jgi:hypothetical protein